MKLGWRKDVEKCQTTITKTVNNTWLSLKEDYSKTYMEIKVYFFKSQDKFHANMTCNRVVTKAARAQVGFCSVLMATVASCHKKRTDAKWSWKIVPIIPVSGNKKSLISFLLPHHSALGALDTAEGVRIQ